MRVLVTGSSGLIGSEAVSFFDEMGFETIGVDNNMRADFFGPGGDTTPNRQRLEATCRAFRHVPLDIRDREGVSSLFEREAIDLVIHAAAQPSHDLSARRPFDDFDVNAGGTLNLLEACRRHRPEAVFVFASTNKVYGDGPNRIDLHETETRFDYADPRYRLGIDETFPVDRSLHTVFGVSKVAADLMVQEYGRNFGLKTGVFRGGCLTGPRHAGVELHGFLSYLVEVARREGRYTIYGYKGKQVRDQIHSRDVVSAFWAFAQRPRAGEVYNLGGGPDNAASLLELIEMIAGRTGLRPELSYSPANRVGDHVCYYTDMARFCAHYPEWRRAYDLGRILDEMLSGAAVAAA